MFVVYVLYNQEHGRIYIGQTKNITARIDLHNNKIFENSYTSRYSGKWEIIYQENVTDRQAALKREKQLKSFRGREFVKKFIPR